MNRSDSITAVALLAVLGALLVVGVVSGTPVRHAIQVTPVLAAALAVTLRQRWGRFAAAPIFALWLFIMVLIWLFLLGIARVVSGHFTPIEIALTCVIGAACVIGLGAVARNASAGSSAVARSAKAERSSVWRAVAVFLLFGAFQVAAIWLSLQPAFARR
jgi:hypothetical protein